MALPPCTLLASSRVFVNQLVWLLPQIQYYRRGLNWIRIDKGR